MPFFDRKKLFVSNKKVGLNGGIVVSIFTGLKHIIGGIHDNKLFHATWGWDQSINHNIMLIARGE